MPVTEFIVYKVAGLQLFDYLITNRKQLLLGCHGQPWRCSKKTCMILVTKLSIGKATGLQPLTLLKKDLLQLFFKVKVKISFFSWHLSMFTPESTMNF